MSSPYFVRGMRIAADAIMLVELEPLGSSVPQWEPGAHAEIVVGDGSIRQFSLCGSPADRCLTVAVRLETPGKGGSAWVHQVLRPGMTVQVRDVRNHFALEPAPDYLFVAGGIGITPLLPMLEQVAASGLPWKLLYFGRSLAAMPFLERLAAWPEHVRLLPGDVPDRLEFSQLVAAEPELTPAGTLVYTCGPVRLIKGVQETMDALGRGDDVRSEYFSAPVTDEEAESGAFTVRLANSGQEFKVEADRSLLDVLTEDAGADILRDCEEGICGTCETRVISGDLEHRDFVLTKTEKEAGDCMMVCVSRARSGVLLLDL